MKIDTDYSGLTVDKYLLISHLGNGSFGAVYKVYDTVLKTYKALKILKIDDPQTAARLFIEAEIPYKCTHKNIVKINEARLVTAKFDGISENVFVIDMHLIADGSLNEAIKKNRLSLGTMIEISTDVLFGLEHAHTNGIIHRDIKPANILLDKKAPYISDFGLATSLNTIISPWKWYVTHAAPECFKNNSVATKQTDIYAFGITMFRMLNFLHNDAWENTIQAIPNWRNVIHEGKTVDKIPFGSFIPNKLKRIIKKGCSPSAQSRYKTALDMRNDLFKLKLGTDWVMVDRSIWKGYNHKTKATYELYIDQLRKGLYQLELTRNGRRDTSVCRKYNTRELAQSSLYDYICQTSLDG